MQNKTHFGIKHVRMSDMWMNTGGNLQGQVLCAIFDTGEEAQRFLDSVRLRPGFRKALSVTEISDETIFDLAADALKYSRMEPLPARDDRAKWAARHDYLRGLLPLSIAA